jgi:hypothetical protein
VLAAGGWSGGPVQPRLGKRLIHCPQSFRHNPHYLLRKERVLLHEEEEAALIDRQQLAVCYRANRCAAGAMFDKGHLPQQGTGLAVLDGSSIDKNLKLTFEQDKGTLTFIAGVEKELTSSQGVRSIRYPEEFNLVHFTELL